MLDELEAQLDFLENDDSDALSDDFDALSADSDTEEGRLRDTIEEVRVEVMEDRPDIAKRMAVAPVPPEEEKELELYRESAEMAKIIGLNLKGAEKMRETMRGQYGSCTAWKRDDEVKLTQKSVGREMFSLV